MGRHLTLREALASGRLAEFVRQAEARGVELSTGFRSRAGAGLARHTAPRRSSVTHISRLLGGTRPTSLTAINRRAASMRIAAKKLIPNPETS